MTLKLNRQELVDLINSMEAGGHDASHLRAVLATLPQAAQPRQGLSRLREEEELTTAEYLNVRVGDLFPNGITDEVLAQLIEMDRRYSLKELQAMCKESGMSTGGDKKALAAKLVASGTLKVEEVEMAEKYVNLNESRDWIGKPGQLVKDLALPEVYLKPLRYEIIVFVRKERGGHDFLFHCKDYEHTPKHGWRFEHVIIDSSVKEQEEVKLAKLTYHPELMLADVAFMVIPMPEGGKTSTDSLPES